MTALLAPILQEFFTAHLVTQRAVSAATIRAYRDTWKLFLAFLSERENVPAHKLETNHVDATEVIAFLDYLENDRANSVATRNLRLAAIKATMAFQATKAPEPAGHHRANSHHPGQEASETGGHVPHLRGDPGSAGRDHRRHLDRQTRSGMFTLAVQTGLRLSEITDLCLASVHLGAAPHVACTGKGRKNRTTPLTSTTASLLKAYFQERSTRPGQALFPNPHGFRAFRRRRSAKALPAPGQGHVHLPRPRQQARHRAYPAPHRRDAFPRSRHRCRRHRFVARPRITSNDRHLPPCRHRHQTQSS